MPLTVSAELVLDGRGPAMETSRWSRWTAIVSVLMLALIAAVVSYSHMYELALRHGEPE